MAGWDGLKSEQENGRDKRGEGDKKRKTAGTRKMTERSHTVEMSRSFA